jgi:hypothetical protein
VGSVLTSVNTTKRYLAQRERGEPINSEAEAELGTLWATASVLIHRTDPDLALRLQQKAEYWTNPENWSEDEIDHNGIQIEEIAEEGRRLLSDV